MKPFYLYFFLKTIKMMKIKKKYLKLLKRFE